MDIKWIPQNLPISPFKHLQKITAKVSIVSVCVPTITTIEVVGPFDIGPHTSQYQVSLPKDIDPMVD